MWHAAGARELGCRVSAKLAGIYFLDVAFDDTGKLFFAFFVRFEQKRL
jgi:hypothetical protein